MYNQASEWKTFYIHAVNFLESKDIDTEPEDPTEKGWKQFKMMFQVEDCQAMQTLIDNGTISLEDEKTAIRVIDTNPNDQLKMKSTFGTTGMKFFLV